MKYYGQGFVIPKWLDTQDAYGIWDTTCLNFASGRYFETKEECQKVCDEMNKED